MAAVGRLLGETRWVERAERVAALITEERVHADRALDVMGGSAGAVLALLSLHRTTRDGAPLRTAIACGEHLLAHAASSLAHRAAGFSHGAAGLAHALFLLSAAAGREDFRAAALDALAFEREARRTPSAAARETSWCNGAVGYGLMCAALAGLVADGTAAREDVEFAVRAVRGEAAAGVVHLCCGAFGHVELLRVAATALSRPEWLEEARALATRLLARAEAAGGHRLFHELPPHTFAPGLFRGVAGIGYTLLQLASGGALPCLLLFE